MSKIIIFILVVITFTFSACGINSNNNDNSSNVNLESSTQSNNIVQYVTPAADNNKKIKAVISKNCNYIYHMLSVSNCGYNNEYGNKYKSFHSQADLQTLKNYENYITVSGGEYAGELYTLCVALPSSLKDDISLLSYFEALIDLFESDNLEGNFEKYKDIYEQSFSTIGGDININSLKEFYKYNEPLKKEITEISKVMVSNYNIYNNEIWEISNAELSSIVNELNKQLIITDYVSKWEELLNYKYKHDDFFAVICNSIQGGPNCIDISYNKDVFYYSGESSSMAKLISHEFGIYLLKDVLVNTAAFQDFSYYKIVEGLAEYFNMIVSGGHTDWDWDNEYIDFYKQLKDKEPEITAEEMFLRGVDFFMPTTATN